MAIKEEKFDLTGLVVKCDGLDIGGTELTGAELTSLDGLTASTAELNILDGVTATTAEVNLLAGVDVTQVEFQKACAPEYGYAEWNSSDSLTVASNSHEIHFLNAAGGGAMTLPAPFAGARFKIYIGATANTSNWTVVTTGGSNLIYGNCVVNGAEVPASAEDTITFVASTSLPGDWVEVVSDGTNWYVSGQAAATGAVTFTAT